jgi:hypothetical protein
LAAGNFGGGDNFKIGDWHEVPDFQFTLAHNGQGRSLNAANKLRSQSCIIDGEAVSCGDDGIASFDRIRYRRHDADVFSGPSTWSNLTATTCGVTRSSFARQHSAAFSRERRWALRLNEHLEADGPDVFHHACIDIYGNYAIKLLRLQGEMIQT